MDIFECIEDLEQKQTNLEMSNMSDSPVNTTCEFCDEKDLEDYTSSAVQEFIEADKHRHPPYESASVERRAEYLKEFHEKFNEVTGYTNNLNFNEHMEPRNLGAFNPVTKEINLNANILNDSDPQQVMETIMHESRHAYQDYAINHPEKVSVDAETINVWEYNFTHYIKPEYDYEAYVNQPVEADANDFSERMYNEGYCNAA